MSQNAKNHQKYFCISMTTLITRVAMENGILPVIAYKTSDKLINKIDLCKSDEEFYAIYMEIIMTFADMIREAKGKKKYSGYVEQCKYYMEQNYNKKMTLEMLAEYTGLNASYLSHIFPKFEGITINEYMNKIRIERAQNLLKYSDRSIIEISDYTGFQSQSYFGKKFKKYTGMTAAEYRTRYKIKEFREEKV